MPHFLHVLHWILRHAKHQNKRLILGEVGFGGGLLTVAAVLLVILYIKKRWFDVAEVREYDDMREFLLSAGNDEIGRIPNADPEAGTLETSLDRLFPNLLQIGEESVSEDNSESADSSRRPDVEEGGHIDAEDEQSLEGVISRSDEDEQ